MVVMASINTLDVYLAETQEAWQFLDILNEINDFGMDAGMYPFKRLRDLRIGVLECPEPLLVPKVGSVARHPETLRFVDLKLHPLADSVANMTPSQDPPIYGLSATCVAFIAVSRAPDLPSVLATLSSCVTTRTIIIDWSAFIADGESKYGMGRGPLVCRAPFGWRYKRDLEDFFTGLHAFLLPRAASVGSAVERKVQLANMQRVILILPEKWMSFSELAVSSVMALNANVGHAFDFSVETVDE